MTRLKIDSPAGLEGFPTGSVVVDSNGYAWQQSYKDQWYTAGDDMWMHPRDLVFWFGPITLVYIPGDRDD